MNLLNNASPLHLPHGALAVSGSSGRSADREIILYNYIHPCISLPHSTQPLLFHIHLLNQAATRPHTGLRPSGWGSPLLLTHRFTEAVRVGMNEI